MAPTSEPDVGDPSKTSESTESETSKCRYCKKVVKEKMQCKKCKLFFHPSCLVAANKLKNNVCVHESDEKQDIVEKLMSEIELLRKIIREQEEKYELVMENKKLLEENNKLLRENNDFLHDKIKEKTKTFSEVVARDGAKNEPIKHQAKKIYKQTRIEESESQLVPAIQGPSNSTKKHTGENEKKGAAQNSVNRQEISTHSHNQEHIRGEEESEENNSVFSRRRNFSSKNKKPLFYGTSEEEGSVKGIPRRIWYFVSRLSPDMTEENLKSIIERQCADSNIVVQKQKLYYDYQSAFKVGVPVEFEEKANNSSFWPKDSRINKFNFFLERKKMQRGK